MAQGTKKEQQMEIAVGSVLGASLVGTPPWPNGRSIIGRCVTVLLLAHLMQQSLKHSPASTLA